MFMKDNKKDSMAAVIIAKKKKLPSGEEVESMEKAPESEEGMQSDYDMGVETAAQDMISAIESKDAKALASAARALISMCKDEMEDSERANED